MDPMYAKSPSVSGSSTTLSREPSSPKRTAKSFLAEIRQQLDAGEIREAKHLASEAAQRHPSDTEILGIHRILNEGRASTSPGTGREMRPEYEWLREPPEQYRGQWVALVGSTVVGSASTLRDLQASLPTDLDETPLAVQIPS